MRDGVQVLVVIAAALATFPGIQGYPTGAPPGQCVGMTPSHGASISQPLNNSPFSVTATPSTSMYYYGGESMNVTVSGSTNFKGLLLQARDANGARVGTFSLLQGETKALKLVDCGGQNTAVTHSARLAGDTITVMWTAPATDAGAIKFNVTVVQAYSTFYVGIESQAMSYKAMGGGGGGGGMTVTTTTPIVTTTTTVSSGGTGNTDDPNAAPLPISAGLVTVGLATLLSVLARVWY